MWSTWWKALVLTVAFMHPAVAGAKPTVVLVADMAEADAPCGCGEIIRLVRAAAAKGVLIREVPPGADRELIARRKVDELPTVLVLDEKQAVRARFVGESDKVVAALRAELTKLAGAPIAAGKPVAGAEAKYPEGADVQVTVTDGRDVPDLAQLAVRGKVTVVDFFADWCGPCREADRHLAEKLTARRDVAVRKLNIVSWDSPLAKHHLAKLPSMPVQVVFGRDGRRIETISALDLAKLDAAIDVASRPEPEKEKAR